MLKLVELTYLFEVESINSKLVESMFTMKFVLTDESDSVLGSVLETNT